MKTFIAMVGGAIIFTSGIVLGVCLVSDKVRDTIKRELGGETVETDNHEDEANDCEIKGFCSNYAE